MRGRQNNAHEQPGNPLLSRALSRQAPRNFGLEERQGHGRAALASPPMQVEVDEGSIWASGHGRAAWPSATTEVKMSQGVVGPFRSSSDNNQLDGVSSASANACMVIGYWGNSGVSRTLVESWDGTSWSVVQSPNKRPSSLYGVSCAPRRACARPSTTPVTRPRRVLGRCSRPRVPATSGKLQQSATSGASLSPSSAM